MRRGGAAAAGPGLEQSSGVRLHGRPLAVEALLRRDRDAVRRRVVLGSLLAVLILASISTVLAFRQYQQGKQRALTDLQARAVAVAGVVNAGFGGAIDVLETAAQAPVVMQGRPAAMDLYLRRVAAGPAATFSGGLGWLDLRGRVQAVSVGTPPHGAEFAGRAYFKQVVATGKPAVSTGFVGSIRRAPLVVVAVPTRTADGFLRGVLVGTILLRSVRESAQALALGFGGLDVVDRQGHRLLDHLAPVADASLLARIRTGASGVVPSSNGLGSNSSDAIAYALAPLPGWIVVIDQSTAALYAAPLHSLELQLGSVGGAVALLIVVLGLVAFRARGASAAQEGRARAWSGLTRGLAVATRPAEVVDGLLHSLAAAFPGALAAVALDDGVHTAASASPALRRALGEGPAPEALAEAGRAGPHSVTLASTDGLAHLVRLSERRLQSLHALPIGGEDGAPLGTLALLSPVARLGPSEWALLEAFAGQAGAAMSRTSLFEREHELAIGLQRSLLPDRLPATEAVELTGHYQAGGLGVEVGGDWYDAVLRPDGVVQLCVGDVSGRGIGAATIMGRLRTSFHAYAYECDSPVEVVRRMLRHVHPDEMITVVCVALDPLTGELAYSCAGHPPPLVLEHGRGGEPRRLEGASAPPLGVAESADLVEARLCLTGSTTLALYTDGLIERRGRSIDEGMEVLGRALTLATDRAERAAAPAAAAAAAPAVVLDLVAAAIGPPDDDVALLLVHYDSERAPFELELPAEPSALPGLRRRLRAWLSARALESEPAAEVVLAVSEACNNAIEHAYRDGASGTLRVRVELEGGTLRIEVADQGSWRSAEASDEGGRGILLMRALMDSAEIDTGAGGTSVRLSRRLAPAEADGEALADAVGAAREPV